MAFLSDGYGGASEGFLTGFAGADAHHLFEVGHKNLAVTDLAGAGCAFDGFDHAVHQVVGHGGRE